MGKNRGRNWCTFMASIKSPGRQAFGTINKEIVAPSAVPLKWEAYQNV